MSFNTTSIVNFSDSNDDCYEAELARRRAKMKALLWEQKEKERFECQAQKEAKIVKQKRLEEEAQRKQEEKEAQWREEKCQSVTNFIRPYFHQFSIDSHGLNGYGKPLKRPFYQYQSCLEAISNGRDIRQINW